MASDQWKSQQRAALRLKIEQAMNAYPEEAWTWTEWNRLAQEKWAKSKKSK